MKRGMSKEEILGHLRGYKTPNSKIGYLKDVLRKRRLLDETTQHSAYEIMGDLYMKQNDTQNAVDSYLHAKMPEKAADAYEKIKEPFLSADVWLKQKNFKRAAEVLERGSHRQQYEWRTRKRLLVEAGISLEKAGDYINAEKDYRQAMEIIRDNGNEQLEMNLLLLAIGGCLEKEGKVKEAEQLYLQRAQELEQGSEETFSKRDAAVFFC